MCFLLLGDVRRVHHTDVGSNGPELAHQVLVAALDKLHLAQLRYALSAQARR